MRIVPSETFTKEYRKLPETIRKKVKRQLSLLASKGLRYSGLNARKMAGVGDVWEARIDLHYRLTFEIQGSLMVLRRVGTHAIYRKP